MCNNIAHHNTFYLPSAQARGALNLSDEMRTAHRASPNGEWTRVQLPAEADF